jgi:small subunit ribosomal protein S5
MREEQQEFTERVIRVNRVAKVVKGGRRFKFNALAVVGNGRGQIGVGFGKANEAPAAIKKALDKAHHSLFKFPLKGATIPHAVTARAGAGKVVMRPASRGTGLIAGGAVRDILETAGVKDVLAKRIGSSNSLSVVNATVKALKMLRDVGMVAEGRGKTIDEVWGVTKT